MASARTKPICWRFGSVRSTQAISSISRRDARRLAGTPKGEGPDWQQLDALFREVLAAAWGGAGT